MRYRNHPGGRKHVFAVLAIVFIFSFPPLQAHAADGFFESLWCDITGLFGYECAPEIVQVVEHMPNGVATVTTTIPPAPEDADRYTASATPEGRVVYTTVENTYITNPVTLIRESSNSSSNGGGNGVSRDLLSRQLDVILENVGENIGNVQGELTDALADIAASLTTALLTVTGNANIGGDLQVTGTLTAGSLAVSSLSSGGAVVAPYFTATSSSASTFVGSVGIGTTSPYRTLTVVGSGTSAIHLESYGGANTFRGQRAGGTESVPTALSAGNSLSNFVGGGYDGTTFVDGASIVMSTQGTWSSTNHASLFQFKLTPTNSTTLTEALRLEADGSLRLATSSTYLQASALGAGSLIMQGMLGVGSSTPWGQLSINPNGITGPAFVIGSSSATNFIVTNGGLVGIGTTSPYAKLSVVGPVVAEYFHATSTTATSTFAGGIAVEGSGLVYDWQTNSVGVGTTNPSTTLHVIGSIRLGGSSTATSSLMFSPAGAYAGKEFRVIFSDGSRGDDYIGWHANSVTAQTFVFTDLETGSDTAQPRVGIGYSWDQVPDTLAGGSLLVSGNVGIGTTTPTHLLDIYSTSALANARLQSTNVAGVARLLTANGDRVWSAGVRGDISDGYSIYDESVATSRLFISTAGKVGIGTTTPASKLDVYNSGGGDQEVARFYSGGNPYITIGNDITSGNGAILLWNDTSDYLAIGAHGFTPALNVVGNNVGIGTTSPAYKLEVYASGANTARFQNINQYNVVTLDNLSGNASLQNILRFNNNGSTAWSVGNDAANSNALTFASSALLDSGQRVVITTGGNVGIGTTTPATYLDVGGLNAGHLAQFGDGGGQTQYISINNSRAMFGYDNTGTAAVVQAAGGKGIEFFVNSNTFLGGTQAMTITSAGNVGVGTTSPWRTFGVTGTAGFDGLTGAVGAGSLCLSANKEMVYNSGSDNCLSSTRATKHDIESLSVNALDIVNALQPSSFVYNGTERTRYGFIAEDTASIDAILATYNEAGQVTGIDDRSILSVVVKAFQELYTGVMSRFAVQDTRIEALEARIRELEARQGIAAPQPPAPEPGPETDGEGTLPETSDESFGGEEMPPDTEESLAGTGQDASGGVGTEIPEPAPELPAP